MDTGPTTPWICGCCGGGASAFPRLAICAECRLALCRSCVMLIHREGTRSVYCRKCAGRLGLISPEKAARRPALWRRLLWVLFPPF